MSTCKECTDAACEHDWCDCCSKCVICGAPAAPIAPLPNWPLNWPKPVKQYPFDRLEYERYEISCNNVIESAEVH